MSHDDQFSTGQQPGQPRESVAGSATPSSGGSPASAAQHVAGSAAEGAREVLDEARSGAGDVTRDAQEQVRELWSRTVDETRTQASTQQERLAGGIQTFAEDLRFMSDGAQGSVASSVAGAVAARAADVGDWLGSRSPEEVLADVRSFARRRPGTFLLIAAGAGVIVGRLGRALKDDSATKGAHREGAPARLTAEPVVAPPEPSYTAAPTPMVEEDPVTDPYVPPASFQPRGDLA